MKLPPNRKLTSAELLQVQRDLYSNSFRDFIPAAWPHIDRAPFVTNWHIGVLADHLQAVAEGRITRLLINVPPGFAKSTIVGVLFSAWLWTRDPTKKIISASHSEKLATRDSRKTRDLVMSEWFQRLWPIDLKADENKKTGFENTERGSREAMPFTSMTGSRGNVVIIDDPHSVKGAKSAADRLSVVETFLEAIPNRINDPQRDAIIVVMQRLHEEDVSGAILERPDLGYDHLCIPMEAEEPKAPTSIGWVDLREPGELAFPKRWGPAEIKKLKASQGPFGYAGQYQQRPAPANDGFFSREWFPRYHEAELPEHLHYYMTSDHAPGGKRDFNVFRIWGVDEKRNLWLVDSFRKRCLMDEAMGIERDPKTGATRLLDTGAIPLIRKWKPFGWYPENDPTWTAIQSFVKAAMRDTNTLCRIEPLPLRGQGDKAGKAQAYQAMASMGMVHLPAGRIGDEALDEYVTFPVGKNDDQVDADGAIARVVSEALPAYIPPSAPQAVDQNMMWRDQPSRMGGDASDLCW